MTLTFRAPLVQEGPGNFVEVPDEILRALGAKKRPAVRVVVNGVELRTTIAVYGGRSLIGFRREIREAAGLIPGETVELSIELDEEERTVELPEDLAQVLAADPEASRALERLSFTHRKEYVTWVEQAKRPATRQQRIQQTLALLKGGRKTPL